MLCGRESHPVGIVNIEQNEYMELARPSIPALSALHVASTSASAAFKSRATIQFAPSFVIVKLETVMAGIVRV
jgi:hypothetical protein